MIRFNDAITYNKPLDVKFKEELEVAIIDDIYKEIVAKDR